MKMLNVFQRVESIHETQTGLVSLFFNNYQLKGSTFKKII